MALQREGIIRRRKPSAISGATEQTPEAAYPVACDAGARKSWRFMASFCKQCGAEFIGTGMAILGIACVP